MFLALTSLMFLAFNPTCSLPKFNSLSSPLSFHIPHPAPCTFLLFLILSPSCLIPCIFPDLFLALSSPLFLAISAPLFFTHNLYPHCSLHFTHPGPITFPTPFLDLSLPYFCPALTKLALDLHVNFCLFVCLRVFPVFFSRRLIGSYTGF